MPSTIHLHPTAELAERVLLPGDPGRALRLAQGLLEAPRMFNHHRGLWGYTGLAGDGAALTIQSTGMGGPSAAIVVSELAELGARRLVRVGTCGALDPALSLGELLIVDEALSEDGTSRALGAGERTHASEALLSALRTAAPPGVQSGAVVTTDLFYDERAGQERAWLGRGAMAVEMETAGLFALAERRGLEAAAILVVSDILLPERVRINPEDLARSEELMGAVATRALAVGAPA